MTIGQFLILHLLAGAGVAGAVYLTTSTTRTAQLWFEVGSALVFWPLYLPLLLARPAPSASPQGSAAPSDDLARTIAQVDAELESAVQSLDGWAGGVLAREQDRLHELRTAWSAQAQRIREMDRLLRRTDYGAPPPADVDDLLRSERLLSSQQAIRQNLERLRQVRARTMQDLLETLAWVRELVSMIHLARFTGAPAARAEELVAQIAAAVEGLSDVTWQPDRFLPEAPAAPVPPPTS
jgi:hypothetical protein